MGRLAINPERLEHYRAWLRALIAKQTKLSAAEWMRLKFPE